MFYPPTSTMLSLYEPPSVRVVYDNAAVISASPRWLRPRAVVARIRARAGVHADYRSSAIDAAACAAPPASTGR